MSVHEEEATEIINSKLPSNANFEEFPDLNEHGPCLWNQSYTFMNFTFEKISVTHGENIRWTNMVEKK